MPTCEFSEVDGVLMCAACGRSHVRKSKSKVIRRCIGKGSPAFSRSRTSHANPELPCVHRGEELRKEKCQVCGEKGMIRTVYACAKHGECAWRKWKSGTTPGVTFCNACDDLTAPPAGQQVPGTERHYQGSIARLEGQTVLVTRRGNWPYFWWIESDQAVGGERIAIDHPLARLGAEDARAFHWAGKLWISFSGLSGTWQRLVVTMMLAELDDQGQAVRVLPVYPPAGLAAEGLRGWEKNWAFFDRDGTLCAVYRSRPWVVLSFDDDFRSSIITHHEWSDPAWEWGHIRGGASPVLHNGEWYCFFHSTNYSPIWYTLGLLTFDAETLLPIRMITTPLLQPEEVVGQKPVVFPCGAILDGDKWRVTYGHNDLECRLLSFDAATIEKQLEDVPCLMKS